MTDQRDTPIDRVQLDKGLIAKLSSVVHLARSRASHIRDRATADGCIEGWRLVEALEELGVAHEELRVAEEELYAQADELCVSNESLGTERDYYRELFDEAPEPYCITDALGVVRAANRQACQLLGVDQAFIAGKPLAVFVSPEDRGILRSLVGQAAQRGFVSRCVVHVEPRGGSPRPNLRVGLACTWGIDTKSTRLRIMLRELPAVPVAEPRADSRTSTHAPIVQPRGFGRLGSLAEATAKLSFIVPELRSPLSGIKGWLQLLMDRSSAPPLRERAHSAIVRNVDNVSRMLEQLVDHERAAAGTLELSIREAAPAELISDVLDSVEPLRKRAQVSVTCQLDSGLPRVQLDPFRVRQILFALLSNAIEFTPREGEVSITVTCHGSELAVTVRDTGHGIARERLDDIFEPFVRLEAGGQHSPGLGLGLTLAKRLAELHAGSLHAESAGPNQGATFLLRLPLAFSQSTPPAVSA